jgi:uncharacterized membrane protein
MKLAQGIDFPLLEQVSSPNFIGADMGDIINKLVLYLFPLAGILMLLYLLFGGYKYMLSRGDPKAIADARDTITTAVVGFIIVFVAFWIVQIVGVVLGIEQITVIFGNPG